METTTESTAGAAMESPANEHNYKLFALQVDRGKESKVAALLEKVFVQEDNIGLMRNVFTPKTKVMNPATKLIEERAQHEGYIYAWFQVIDYTDGQTDHKEVLNPKIWHLLKDVKHQNGFASGCRDAVGFKAYPPYAVSDDEAVEIETMLEKSEFSPAISVSEWVIGSSVHIIEGPFSDFPGIVREVKENRRKLKVGVNIFSRETIAELDFRQVKEVV